MQLRELRRQVQEVNNRLYALQGQTSFDRFPPFVKDFSNELCRLGVDHHLLADVLDITDPEWHTAIENYLGSRRFWVMVDSGEKDFDQAYKVVDQFRYQPGIRAPRPRPKRTKAEYQNTIWNILDLPENEMSMWGYHLDDLGYQLMARSAEEARLLNQNRPFMRIFTPSGVVSQTDLFARSVLPRLSQEIALFCGKRSTELELKRLTAERERLQKELDAAESEYAQAKRQEGETSSLRQACTDFHAARQKLMTAKSALKNAEDIIDELYEQKVENDFQVDQARDELEQLRTEKVDIERQIERLTTEISQARATRSGSASQLRQVPNVQASLL